MFSCVLLSSGIVGHGGRLCLPAGSDVANDFYSGILLDLGATSSQRCWGTSVGEFFLYALDAVAVAHEIAVRAL